MAGNNRFVKRFLKKLPLTFIVLLMLFAGAIVLFVYIIHEVLWEKEVAMDEAVFNYLSANIISPFITGFMETITHFASATFLKIGYAVLAIIYLLKKNYKRCIEIAVIGTGGYLINYVMKLSFKRVRPPDPLIEPLKNFSFPSGHATSAFIFYGLLIYLIWKTELSLKLKYLSAVLLLLFSMLIGFSRVYLRVHYTSDVLGGFCIGLSWLALSIYIMERLKKSVANETIAAQS